VPAVGIADKAVHMVFMHNDRISISLTAFGRMDWTLGMWVSFTDLEVVSFADCISKFSIVSRAKEQSVNVKASCLNRS
jgi:hypothetical protein